MVATAHHLHHPQRSVSMRPPSCSDSATALLLGSPHPGKPTSSTSFMIRAMPSGQLELIAVRHSCTIARHKETNGSAQHGAFEPRSSHCRIEVPAEEPCQLLLHAPVCPRQHSLSHALQQRRSHDGLGGHDSRLLHDARRAYTTLLQRVLLTDPPVVMPARRGQNTPLSLSPHAAHAFSRTACIHSFIW